MKTSGHVVYDTHYHIVFCTKYRRKVLVDGVDEALKATLAELAESEESFTIEELEVMPDHVHLLASIDARKSPHLVIGKIKGHTAHRLRADFPALKSRIPSLWTRSYFIATTGGASIDTIKEYIENQKRSENARSFQG